MWKDIKDFFLNSPRAEKIFLFSAMMVGFLISCEYGVTKPASNSIFISFYSAEAFPLAWLMMVPLNLLVIYLYNRFLPKWGCLKTMGAFASLVMGINLISGICLTDFHYFPFVQYLWKEVYILLMFKQLWSLVHSTLSMQRAKYLYGLIFAAGGVGAICGGMISGTLAIALGSQKLFFLTPPIYLMMFFFYKKAVDKSVMNEGYTQKDHPPEEAFTKSGFSLFKSSTLKALLFLTLFMQISAAFIEYQFNISMQNYIPHVDERTAYVAKLMSLVNLFSTAFQFFGSFLFIQFFGLRNTHLFIPLTLSINTVVGVLFPSAFSASLAYVYIKSMDYSVFGIAREMLYIPLKLDEKFRAKAIIDVFASRSAKAFASFFCHALQFFHRPMTLWLGMILSFLCILWMVLVIRIFRKPVYQKALLDMNAEIKENNQ
jgi:AAA family ATP:ADP antiporter